MYFACFSTRCWSGQSGQSGRAPVADDVLGNNQSNVMLFGLFTLDENSG